MAARGKNPATPSREYPLGHLTPEESAAIRADIPAKHKSRLAQKVSEAERRAERVQIYAEESQAKYAKRQIAAVEKEASAEIDARNQQIRKLQEQARVIAQRQQTAAEEVLELERRNEYLSALAESEQNRRQREGASAAERLAAAADEIAAARAENVQTQHALNLSKALRARSEAAAAAQIAELRNREERIGYIAETAEGLVAEIGTLREEIADISESAAARVAEIVDEYARQNSQAVQAVGMELAALRRQLAGDVSSTGAEVEERLENSMMWARRVHESVADTLANGNEILAQLIRDSPSQQRYDRFVRRRGITQDPETGAWLPVGTREFNTDVPGEANKEMAERAAWYRREQAAMDAQLANKPEPIRQIVPPKRGFEMNQYARAYLRA